MPLNKSELRNRLTAAGLWDRFVDRRERLKKQGLTPEEAWEKAALDIDQPDIDPPATHCNNLAQAPGRGSRADRQQASRLRAKKQVNFVEEARWVAEHLQVEDTTPDDAPSLLAYSLLKWAQRSPTAETEFWRAYLSKMLPTKQQLEVSERLKDDGRSVQTLLDQFRSALDDRSEVPVLSPGSEGPQE